MASPPSLPSALVSAAASQARSAVPNGRNAAPSDRSVAPSDRSVAPTDRNAAPNDRGVASNDRSGSNRHVASNDRSAAPTASRAAPVKSGDAPDQADGSASFESVLEAQLSQPSEANVALVQGTDGAPSRSKEDATAQAAAAEPAAAYLFLPANMLVPPASNAVPTAGDAVLAARDGRQDGGRALPPMPGVIAAAADPVGSQAGAASAADPATQLLAPASFAATLQGLPATDGEDKHATQPATHGSSAAPDPGSPVPMLSIGERRLEAMPGGQQLANTVPGLVGEAHWGEAFSQRVVWMVGQQVHSAQFRVEPPQLGPIEVKLSITNDQATLTFAAPHAAAREAIQMSLPRLQEMLLESGVTLGSVFVGAQTSQNQHEAAADGRGAAGARGGAAGVAESESITIDSSLPVRRTPGLVDLYA